MRYLLRRLLVAIPSLALITLVSFAVIDLPPGDYLSVKVAELEMAGGGAAQRAEAQQLREKYGLDKPFPVRFGKWVTGIVLHGDFGKSFRYERDITAMIGERLVNTLALSIGSLAFVYAMAVPLGILAAIRKGRATDHAITVIGTIGASVPGFLLALIITVTVFRLSAVPIYGLFSSSYQHAPWSAGRVVDLLQHLAVPILAVGLSGIAPIQRILRANMLDVLSQPYIMTARAKGLSETVVVVKHAARIAINPIVSMIGMSLPDVLSGGILVSSVLGLPTVGPLLQAALTDKDMYLGGTILFFNAVLLVLGNILADLLLAAADPRIRDA